MSDRGRSWFGPLLLRLHFLAGILVGPFLLVAAFSGAVYALTPTLEQVVYATELHAPVRGEPLPLAAQIASAADHVGDAATLSAVRPAPEPGDTTRVMFADPDLGPSESRAVFIDPENGEVRGDLTVYGTSGALPLRTWVDGLHRDLHLGDPGRLYSELAASWLWIVALAGLALWVRRLRTARSKRDLLLPNRRHTGYRRLFGWHASVGVWVVIGAVFLSATGITWSQYAGANVSQLRAVLGGATPVLDTALGGGDAPVDEHAGHHGPTSAPTGAANPATFDAVLAIARRINANAAAVEIAPPLAPGAAWTVREIKTSFPTEVDQVAIDGTTLQVVDRVDFADFPLAAKLARWGVDLHMGAMFGVVNQLALFLLAMAIAAMVVLGYAMWAKRRPPRSPRRFGGAPPEPGALRAAPWWGVLAVAGAGVAIGLLLPLVGVTLVAFVLVDTVQGLRARRPA